MKSRQDIYVTYGTDAGAMAKAVLSAAEVAAAVPDRDALIGLKPNLVLASPAGLGATTHLEMAAGARPRHFGPAVIASWKAVMERRFGIRRKARRVNGIARECG